MKNLRTLEQVCEEEREIVYVVAALPKWAHYDPEDCPAPIRKWVEEHYPEVVIEELAGFEVEYALGGDSDDPSKRLSDFLPTPIFRVCFDAEQAKNFQEAWSNPPLDTPDSPGNFYFLICDSLEALWSMGVPEAFDPDTVLLPLELGMGQCVMPRR